MIQDQPGPSISEIRGMSDEEIVRRHDALTAYFVADMAMRAAYVAELERRAANRSTRASNRLAVIAVIVSVLSLITGVVVPLLRL